MFWSNQDIVCDIKQIFTEPETEVKWYCDSIEEIVIVYIFRNRLRGTFACACNTHIFVT